MASKTEKAHALDVFVERFTRGDTLTEADLEGIRKLTVPEDGRLDYKEAAWTDKDTRRPIGPGHPRTLKAKVAKYVSGFANAHGGVLVLGIKEHRAKYPDGTVYLQRLSFDPIPEARRRSVVDAVRAGLEQLAGQLPRGARMQVIESEGEREGFYVMVGTGRARRLTTCVEDSRLIYYLRLHDSTTHAPDYLAADLFLGRRQQPISRAVLASASSRRLANSPSDLRPRVTFENAGLAWMEHPRAGFIGSRRPNAKG